jgi:hypothetical protein
MWKHQNARTSSLAVCFDWCNIPTAQRCVSMSDLMHWISYSVEVLPTRNLGCGSLSLRCQLGKYGQRSFANKFGWYSEQGAVGRR